jgi:hypothetical protein
MGDRKEKETRQFRITKKKKKNNSERQMREQK